MSGKGKWGLHIYTHNNTDWVQWFEVEYDRNKAYLRAKRKAGMEKSRKTPYRIVKKVQR